MAGISDQAQNGMPTGALNTREAPAQSTTEPVSSQKGINLARRIVDGTAQDLAKEIEALSLKDTNEVDNNGTMPAFKLLRDRIAAIQKAKGFTEEISFQQA